MSQLSVSRAPSRAGVIIRDPHTRSEVLCEYGEELRELIARLNDEQERYREQASWPRWQS